MTLIEIRAAVEAAADTASFPVAVECYGISVTLRYAPTATPEQLCALLKSMPEPDADEGIGGWLIEDNTATAMFVDAD